jgi:hypothetical protein
MFPGTSDFVVKSEIGLGVSRNRLAVGKLVLFLSDWNGVSAGNLTVMFFQWA